MKNWIKVAEIACLVGTAILGIGSAYIGDKQRDQKIAEEVAKHIADNK